MTTAVVERDGRLRGRPAGQIAAATAAVAARPPVQLALGTPPARSAGVARDLAGRCVDGPHPRPEPGATRAGRVGRVGSHPDRRAAASPLGVARSGDEGTGHRGDAGYGARCCVRPAPRRGPRRCADADAAHAAVRRPRPVVHPVVRHRRRGQDRPDHPRAAFPMYINTFAGIRGVDVKLVEAARTAGLSSNT